MNNMRKVHTILLGLVAAVLVLLFLVSPTTSCTPQEESSLLQFLYQLSPDSGRKLITGGSWRNGTSCCTWEGITCDRNGTVTELSLPSRGLEGNISASLANLTGLRRLDLSRNSLSGGLPPELLSSGSVAVLDVSFNRLSGRLEEFLRSSSSSSSSMPYHPLQVLNISNNFFVGDFPSTLWEKRRDLVEVNASRNSFHGGIPSSFCAGASSARFAVLDLSDNLFSGGIPAVIGECSALRVLKVGNNDIGGDAPDELFNAISLEHISFPKCGLGGKLGTAQIAKLRHLAILDLSLNNLAGKIPDSIGQLQKLEELHLGYNNLSGELPSALGNCASLRILKLERNNLSGNLSKVNFSGLPNLEVLNLMSNNFTGKIPESVYSCSKLKTLELSSNNFHGELSQRIANLKSSLSFLSVANNDFKNIANVLHALKNSGKITTLLMGANFRGEAMPDDATMVDGFPGLRVLSLGSCLLSGKIPVWLSKSVRLEILDLSNNELTGPIPVWIGTLNFLYFIDVSNNWLTEDLPTGIMEMPMLQYENFAYLSDPIYVLPRYQVYYEGTLNTDGMMSIFPAVLNLGNNHLTGTIPSEIGQLKSLLLLNLSSNSLSGDIPPELCNLTNLHVLDLSNNHLTGPIPSDLNNLHYLSAFDVSYNDLEGGIPSGLPSETIADGNPKLCGPLLGRNCTFAEAPSDSPFSMEQFTGKIITALAFGAFFFVGVIYDQIVLSRFFARP